MEHSTSNSQFSSYFQAKILKPEKTWFIVAVLKSFDHLAFDRALENTVHTFEFFVPVDMENTFIEAMVKLQEQGLIAKPVKMKNRLEK